jgi:hypothetical protein
MILSFSGSTGTEYTVDNPNPEIVLDECSIMITFWELYDGPLRNAAMTFPVITPQRFETIKTLKRKAKAERKAQREKELQAKDRTE